jgi:hypothetical protein
LIRNKLILKQYGLCWLKPDHNVIPSPDQLDRGTSDKGFGNFNTFRATFWIELEINNRKIYVFNSHYPLSGDSKTRIACALKEREIIKQIAKDNLWFNCGDKNLLPNLPTDTNEHNAKTILDTLIGNDYLFRNEDIAHEGINTSWLGFNYDKFLCKDVGNDTTLLDAIISNIKAIKSIILPNANSEILDNHCYPSDHAIIAAHYNID